MTFILLFVAVIMAVLLFRSMMLDCDGKYAALILNGFILRLFILLIDYFEIIEIPFSHNDADGFHETAEGNQNSAFFVYYTNYSVFLTGLYYLTDCAKWFAQYINVTFGVLLLIYIRKILFMLEADDTAKKWVMMISAYMPFLIIYSGMLLREAWVSFFVVLSFYYFIRWYLSPEAGPRTVVLCVLSVFAAMLMHAGCIGMLVGYFMAFVTYNRQTNTFRISKTSYISLFFILILMAVFIINISVLGDKFVEALEDPGEALSSKNEGEGGESDYLTNLDFSNPVNILLFFPIKMFYFLYSPIILNWRGLNDIVAFLLDSSVYLGASWFIIKRHRVTDKSRLLRRYALIALFFTVFIFSFGTTNSGTAIRHRAKICSLILLTSALPEKKDEDKSLIQHDEDSIPDPFR